MNGRETKNKSTIIEHVKLLLPVCGWHGDLKRKCVTRHMADGGQGGIIRPTHENGTKFVARCQILDHYYPVSFD